MEYRHRHTDGHSLNKNECCSLSLILLKIATFSDSDSAKTLSICPLYGLLHKTLQMYENFPQTALMLRVLHLNICHCLDVVIFRLAHIELRSGVEVLYASSQHGIFNLPEHALVGTNASQFIFLLIIGRFNGCLIDLPVFPKLFWILH